MDMGNIVGRITGPIVGFVSAFLKFAFGGAIVFLIFALLFFFVRYRVNPFKLNADKLRDLPFIRYKYYDLLRWLLVDFLERYKTAGEFKEFGFTFWCGMQGTGKTISMVKYLERMKAKYPKCIIVTNFGYYNADYIMKDWRDILTIRNGTDGVIFAIDEIQSEYSSASWKDVPEDLLSEISQQRKQRIKIVATAQFYSRIAKPLREQATTVVACSTFAGRLTKNREYNAHYYATAIDNPIIITKKIKTLSKTSFVQSDALRSCYDTYEKIKRMRKTKFTQHNERVAE